MGGGGVEMGRTQNNQCGWSEEDSEMRCIASNPSTTPKPPAMGGVYVYINTHFLSIQIIIQPVAGGKLGDHLPVAHTCFNLLDLPRYATKDLLKNKLSQAVEYSTGFGLA